MRTGLREGLDGGKLQKMTGERFRGREGPEGSKKKIFTSNGSTKIPPSSEERHGYLKRGLTRESATTKKDDGAERGKSLTEQGGHREGTKRIKVFRGGKRKS